MKRPLWQLLLQVAQVVRGLAASTNATLGTDMMAVTVSAGPIAVVEAPPDGRAAPSTTPSDQTLRLPATPLSATLALLEAGRGRPVRDLVGMIRRATHRLIRSLGDELRDYVEGTADDAEGSDAAAPGGTGPPAGRRKKNDGWPMLGAGLIMGGTLLTIGLGALAAMSGKALMSSMLALGMSLMSAFRGGPRRCRRSGDNGNGCGGGDGDDSSRYEIIARPVITHGHTHSAVLHHDPGAPAGYPGYVRSLAQAGSPEQMLASAIDASASSPTSLEVVDFARSGATRLNSSGASDSSADDSSPPPWLNAVIGMRGPAVVSAQQSQGPQGGQGTSSWGKLRTASTQPRALAGPTTPGSTLSSTSSMAGPHGD